MDDMRKSFFTKFTKIFCLSFPALWLFLPDIAVIYYNPDLGYSLKSIGLLLTVLCTIPITLLISKNLRQFWLWNLPFAFFSGLYTAYIIYYHDIPYDGMWFAIWNASGEVLSGTAKFFWYYSFVNLSGFLVYCACLFHPAQQKMIFSRNLKLSYFLFSTVIVMVVLNVTNFFYQRIPIQRMIDQSVVFENYPYGMLGMLVKTSIAFSNNKHISVPAVTRADKPDGREIYVLVIGEAARGDDWLTVSKETHSKILTDPDVLVFKDAVSQANFTSISLPLILTGASEMKDAFSRPLWISLAKAAGCSTGWITNATEPYNYAYSNDFYDLNINRNAWAGFSATVYDEVLLPEIQRAITQGPQKLCLVVHFIGSHFDYRKRYRADLARYTVNVDDYNDFASANHTAAFRNAYDNSLIQTNVVLQGIVSMLEKVQATSFLIYTSDHAESFDDRGDKLYFHGNSHPPKVEIQVPFFVWASPEFQERYPAKWQALEKNLQRPISNSQILPTLMDALSIDSRPDYLRPSLMQSYQKDVERKVLLPQMDLVDVKSLQ
jgi:glucan phosphoethanolaminetransferase (alkaline phosphatase superfamily)